MRVNQFISVAVMLLCMVYVRAEAGGRTVEWQDSTLRLVAERGCYARMIRLQSGEILCCYQFKGESWVKRSADEGRSWDEGTCVTAYRNGAAANPELLQLKNGRLMLCYNERPDDGESSYGISVVFSDDKGLKWGEPVRIFEAGRTFANGCWEPASLQYPDGEIQIFFANEASYTYSDEQEISVISSKNNGVSWQGPKTVSFRHGKRDGMPVPCLLKDGRTVVVAIEDNGLNGEMKPVVLRDTIENRWQRSIITGSGSRRESALLHPLPKDVYAGAPYICRMPDGVTLLAVQSRERRAYEEPAVYVGDGQARHFANRTFPLKLKPEVEGSWNSLFVKSADTVTLISTTTLQGKRGIWAIDGKVVGAPGAE